MADPTFLAERSLCRRWSRANQGLSSKGEKVSLPLKEHREFLSK